MHGCNRAWRVAVCDCVWHNTRYSVHSNLPSRFGNNKPTHVCARLWHSIGDTWKTIYQFAYRTSITVCTAERGWSTLHTTKLWHTKQFITLKPNIVFVRCVCVSLSISLSHTHIVDACYVCTRQIRIIVIMRFICQCTAHSLSLFASKWVLCQERTVCFCTIQCYKLLLSTAISAFERTAYQNNSNYPESLRCFLFCLLACCMLPGTGNGTCFMRHTAMLDKGGGMS